MPLGWPLFQKVYLKNYIFFSFCDFNWRKFAHQPFCHTEHLPIWLLPFRSSGLLPIRTFSPWIFANLTFTIQEFCPIDLNPLRTFTLYDFFHYIGFLHIRTLVNEMFAHRTFAYCTFVYQDFCSLEICPSDVCLSGLSHNRTFANHEICPLGHLPIMKFAH